MVKIDVKKIAIARGNQCMTIKTLADKSGLMVTTLNLIEKGKRNPRLDTVGKIAKALGKSVEDFVADEKPSRRK